MYNNNYTTNSWLFLFKQELFEKIQNPMKKIILFLIVLFATNSYAQIPEIVSQQCYADQESNYYHTIEKTGDGYLIGIGIYSGENVTNYHGLSDIWILKVDSAYNMIWEKCYGGSDYEIPQKIININDSEFFIFGFTSSTDGDVQSTIDSAGSLWVVKIDGQGNIIWENTYGCQWNDDPRDMILTPDGGFVMIDHIQFGGGDVTNYYGSGDTWMCKCDSLGNIEWEKTLGNDGYDYCATMIMNSQNNIMMIGAAQKHGGLVECYPDEVWRDVWLVELDLQGNIISQHCYGGSDYDIGYNILELNDGYILSCYTDSNDGDVSGLHGPTGGPPGGWEDIWVVRLDEQFNITWQKCLGGYKGDSPGSIIKTNDENIIIFGTTSSNDGDVSGNHSYEGGIYTDIWAVKLSTEGEILWQQCYGGVERERIVSPHNVIKKTDYNFVISSSTKYGPSYDVPCSQSIYTNENVWLFEIKDCSQYAPAIPQIPAGPDTVCTANSQQSIYTIPSAALAWNYNWKLVPETAGDIIGDSLQASVTWSASYEGTATIIVRSSNDCGFSGWSQPYYTQVYSCLGSKEILPERMKVYPNPAGDFVLFEIPSDFNKNPSAVIVRNLHGQEVASLSVQSETTVWDCSSAKEGIYFYTVVLEQNTWSGKLIVNHLK
jgi:hypothetical protein